MQSTQPPISYEVPFNIAKHFTPEEQSMIRNTFKNYDNDSNGTIDLSEFKQVLKDMGQGEVTEEK